MGTSLARKLRAWATLERTPEASSQPTERDQVAATISALGEACIEIGALLNRDALGLGGAVGETPEGDVQKTIDVEAESIVLRHLAGSPVAFVGSEERLGPIVLDDQQPLVVAIDPLDGSDNVDINAPVGSIFSIYRSLGDPTESLLQVGTEQLAAGVVIYGPMTVLLLTVGHGTDLYALSPTSEDFQLSREGLQIPARCDTFAINSSNFRHWSLGYQAYYNDLLAGAQSERGRNFNTRWLGALVGEALRIFLRGGVYVYPADQREGYSRGRLRLVYEANPIAMLVQQAGGQTTDGTSDILSALPTDLHQRIPLVFGSEDEVDVIRSYNGLPTGSRSPLFAQRGLFLSA